jgi:lipopolysaccharide transport protein LptA
MELDCERLTVKLGNQSGGKFESIIAETNVNIEVLDERGQPYHCTGGRATYTYAREIMELTENPRVKTAQGLCHGDIITYDRVNSTIKVTNPRTEFTAPSDATKPR